MLLLPFSPSLAAHNQLQTLTWSKKGIDSNWQITDWLRSSRIDSWRRGGMEIEGRCILYWKHVTFTSLYHCIGLLLSTPVWLGNSNTTSWAYVSGLMFSVHSHNSKKKKKCTKCTQHLGRRLHFILYKKRTKY